MKMLNKRDVLFGSAALGGLLLGAMRRHLR